VCRVWSPDWKKRFPKVECKLAPASWALLSEFQAGVAGGANNGGARRVAGGLALGCRPPGPNANPRELASQREVIIDDQVRAVIKSAEGFELLSLVARSAVSPYLSTVTQ